MSADKQQRAFISYSRTNKEFAIKLARGLRSAGYPVWFDQLDIPTGSRWDDEVEKALRECSIFMIILTPASIASNNVKDEIGYAIDHGKRILPVLLENCDVPLRLRRFQYVDFTSKSFEEGFESAKELLESLFEETSVALPKRDEVETGRLWEVDKTKAEQLSHHMREANPRMASTGYSQKNPVSKLLVIGGIGVFILVVLCLAVVGYSISSLIGNVQGTEVPVITSQITEEVLPTDLPDTLPLEPSATPSFEPPVAPYVRIIAITVDAGQHYVVEYETFEYTEERGGMHVHFFFDTVPPEQAGMPGSGPWVVYYGPRPFTKYTVSDRPAGAVQMCALVANDDHSIQLKSGNCVNLP